MNYDQIENGKLFCVFHNILFRRKQDLSISKKLQKAQASGREYTAELNLSPKEIEIN